EQRREREVRRLPALLRAAGDDEVVARPPVRLERVQRLREDARAVGLDVPRERRAVQPAQAGDERCERQPRPACRHARGSARIRRMTDTKPPAPDAPLSAAFKAAMSATDEQMKKIEAASNVAG